MKKFKIFLLAATAVLLFNSCFFEAQTEEAAADTSTATISAPTGVTATKGAYYDYITISWNGVSGASYYKVYRATSSSATYDYVFWTEGTTVYNLSTAHSNASQDPSPISSYLTYYYKVTAVDSNENESALSSADYGYLTRGSLKIVNNTSYSSVTEFYFASDTTAPASYGSTNLFSSSPLTAGSTTYYRFAPQRYINFKFVWGSYWIDKDGVDSQISGLNFYISDNEVNTMLIGATSESTYYYYLSDFTPSKRFENSLEISEKIE